MIGSGNTNEGLELGAYWSTRGTWWDPIARLGYVPT